MVAYPGVPRAICRVVPIPVTDTLLSVNCNAENENPVPTYAPPESRAFIPSIFPLIISSRFPPEPKYDVALTTPDET